MFANRPTQRRFRRSSRGQISRGVSCISRRGEGGARGVNTTYWQHRGKVASMSWAGLAPPPSSSSGWKYNVHGARTVLCTPEWTSALLDSPHWPCQDHYTRTPAWILQQRLSTHNTTARFQEVLLSCSVREARYYTEVCEENWDEFFWDAYKGLSLKNNFLRKRFHFKHRNLRNAKSFANLVCN